MGDPAERLGSEGLDSGAAVKTDDLCMEIDPPFQENVATAEDWRKALNRVVPAVVVLRTTATRSFDTESAAASYATGFVVDKRRGIILTNRHVVKPGPVVAEAMFLNREEVPVHPIYRDPVHDFGFFCYDPGAIQFLNYEEIPLAPEAACVGLEIRVVGNDSGEKVSILAGTLARLDRDAPHYKKYVAASGTKGGSSGSPVIDWQGRAVALNAGSKSSSASAFFLPLERVVRALRFLQKESETYVDKWKAVSIPRGTLQMTFLHKGFDETRRLGLRSETEQIVRHASPAGETGMLVVDSVVPGGPGYKHLEPGDVLVRVNGEVQDLHSITPDYFLEVSGAVIHPLSYQQKRIDFLIRHESHDNVFMLEAVSVLVTVDRHEWYAPPQIYTRDDSTGLWNAKPAFKLDSPFLSLGAKDVENLSRQSVSLTGEHACGGHVCGDNSQELVDGVTSMETNCEDPSECVSHHNASDGVVKKRKVDEDLSADGNVVADFSLNDSRETKLEKSSIIQDDMLMDYQGATAATANASVAERVIEPTLVMFEPALRRGDSVYLVGLSRSLQATSRKSVVTNPCAALNIGSADSPRYRATNMEVIELDTDFGSTFSGVLTDEQGRVQAIWGSFSTQLKFGCSTSEDHQFVRGIPIYAISQVLDKIISGANGSPLLINGVERPMPLVRILEVELYPTLLSKARSFGLSDDWIQALVKKDPVRRQVLRVKGCLAGSKADNLLEQGDMVLAINKEPVTCFRDIENACQALDKSDANDGKLHLTIFRQGQEVELFVGTDVRDGNGTARAINWCGCIVQDPHPAVRALGFLPEEGHGVYVARPTVFCLQTAAVMPTSCDGLRYWSSD
ncbi:hypothetical protein JHK87_031945 [Glycine soja]|nr:hypothetical protein JHK87_031945 [Glycine soja]